MKHNRILCAAAAALLCASASMAQDFNKHFCDSTLRIDYILSGKPGDVNISLMNLEMDTVWGGRTSHLSQKPYIGCGDIIVTSAEGDTIYANAFSSLFSEWLDMKDDVPHACQCPLLVPMPKEPVCVTAHLFDKHHNVIAEIKHTVDPSDILIRKYPNAPRPHRYLHKGSAPGAHIGVAILGEGYSAQEMDQFYEDAQMAADAILSHEPFASMSDRFDFIAVETPSQESGLSVPKTGEWHHSAFNSHYSTFYSDRYLTSPAVFAMYDALHGLRAQHIVVLANTDVYGGGGIFNSYTLTSARNPKRIPVTAHEFGHSFGGLADEYFYENDATSDTYPLDAEPWEPNITTLVDFHGKWENLLPEGLPFPTPVADASDFPVGLYEGGGYSFHGMYRPANYCRMRVNDVEGFCPACQQALERIILYYTEPD